MRFAIASLACALVAAEDDASTDETHTYTGRGSPILLDDGTLQGYGQLTYQLESDFKTTITDTNVVEWISDTALESTDQVNVFSCLEVNPDNAVSSSQEPWICVFVNTRNVSSDLDGDMTITVQNADKTGMNAITNNANWNKDPTGLDFTDEAECVMLVSIEKGVAGKPIAEADSNCADFDIPQSAIELKEKSWKVRVAYT